MYGNEDTPTHVRRNVGFQSRSLYHRPYSTECENSPADFNLEKTFSQIRNNCITPHTETRDNIKKGNKQIRTCQNFVIDNFPVELGRPIVYHAELILLSREMWQIPHHSRFGDFVQWDRFIISLLLQSSYVLNIFVSQLFTIA